jgi:hypothetical protein
LGKIETLRFNFDSESDEKKKQVAFALYESAVNALEGERAQTRTDNRLSDSYDLQIRAQQNNYRITVKELGAEMATA